MPAVSAARIAANRLNAQRSTGPRTPEGKSRSRENALRHGLAGAGVVVPPDLAGEVEAKLAAVRAEMRPQTTLGEFLLHQVTLASVRCRHAARQESANLAQQVRSAVADWDDARTTEVEAAFHGLRDEPVLNRRRLLRTPEGTTRLVEALAALRRDLGALEPTWDAARGAWLEALLGHPADTILRSTTSALSRAILGDLRGIEASSVAHLPGPVAIQAWARNRLGEAVQAAITQLAEHFETFDFEAIEADRAEAPERALFDARREALLARRYEASQSRLFFRALREFHAVEADAADRADLPGPRLVLPPHEPSPPPQSPFQPQRDPTSRSEPTRAEVVDLAIGREVDAASTPEPLGSFGEGVAASLAEEPMSVDCEFGITPFGSNHDSEPAMASELSPERLRLVVGLLT